VGTTKTLTVYVRNEGTLSITLNKSLSNWNPTTLSSFLKLDWDYSNQALSPSTILKVVLSMSVAANTPATSSFSFDTTITAMNA
jgi:hypothetical protein